MYTKFEELTEYCSQIYMVMLLCRHLFKGKISSEEDRFAEIKYILNTKLFEKNMSEYPLKWNCSVRLQISME